MNTADITREHMVRERSLRKAARRYGAAIGADPELGARIAAGTELPRFVTARWGGTREMERSRLARERRGE